MDTKLIEYILTIAETKSIAKSAEELFLTESALNQQLLKLEKELGAPLFVRTRNHWELTDVGTLYVESSKKMLEIKKDTYSRIEDMAKRWKGTVTVGLTPERGIQMFTAIYPEIHAQYPETIFQPYEADVETQIKLLDSGQLDFGFHTIFEHKYKHIIYRHILYEPFYLCVPRSHPLAYKDKRTPENYPEISLTEFKNDLFTLVRKTSTLRAVIDRLFAKAGFKPKLLFESISMRTMQRLAANGQCCSIIPRYYAVEDDDVAYFTLGPESYWELSTAYAKNHYINAAMETFIRMASDYWLAHSYIEY